MLFWHRRTCNISLNLCFAIQTSIALHPYMAELILFNDLELNCVTILIVLIY